MSVALETHSSAYLTEATQRIQPLQPLGRVDRRGCPPRPPSDPGLHITRTRFLTYDFAALRNRLWTTRGLGKP